MIFSSFHNRAFVGLCASAFLSSFLVGGQVVNISTNRHERVCHKSIKARSVGTVEMFTTSQIP